MFVCTSFCVTGRRRGRRISPADAFMARNGPFCAGGGSENFDNKRSSRKKNESGGRTYGRNRLSKESSSAELFSPLCYLIVVIS